MTSEVHSRDYAADAEMTAWQPDDKPRKVSILWWVIPTIAFWVWVFW